MASLTRDEEGVEAYASLLAGGGALTTPHPALRATLSPQAGRGGAQALRLAHKGGRGVFNRSIVFKTESGFREIVSIPSATSHAAKSG